MSEIQDPHGYLQTEARIIAEDRTHAVIAVRVQKSFFARNLLLMAALAELMPCQEKPAIPEPPRGAR
jgi:hypothetical protein